MSLVKTVEMRVLADAGDAQAKLDELDAKAKDLDSSAIKMRFRLDDADGKAQLDDLRVKADHLGFKDVSIKVRVDGAGRAIGELEAVKAEADHVSGGGGILSRLFGGGPPLSGGGGIPVLGSLFGPAGLAIVPAIAAVATEVTGLASGFAAAGAGAAAFAVLALPAIKKVDAALTDSKAQLKTLGKLSPDEAGAVTGIRQLGAEYKKMSLAFEPAAFKVFNEGLKVARNLLPAVSPFANTFATSLDGLLKRADKFTQSSGFKKFLDQFHSLEGPSVTAIGNGIGQVANSIGKLMTRMSGKDVAQAITIFFDIIAGSINTVSGFVAHLMSNWDGMSGAARRDTHEVAGSFDALRHDIATAGHDIASTFDSIRHGAASMADGVVHTIEGMPGKILGVFKSAGGWLVNAGEAIVGGLIRGLESKIGDLIGVAKHIGSIILSHKGPIEYDRVMLVPAGQAIMDGLMGGMGSRMPALTGQLAGITRTLHDVPGPGRAGFGGGGTSGGGDVHFHINGLIVDPQGTSQKIHQLMREYKRGLGGASLGLG